MEKKIAFKNPASIFSGAGRGREGGGGNLLIFGLGGKGQGEISKGVNPMNIMNAWHQYILLLVVPGDSALACRLSSHCVMKRRIPLEWAKDRFHVEMRAF